MKSVVLSAMVLAHRPRLPVSVQALFEFSPTCFAKGLLSFEETPFVLCSLYSAFSMRLAHQLTSFGY